MDPQLEQCVEVHCGVEVPVDLGGDAPRFFRLEAVRGEQFGQVGLLLLGVLLDMLPLEGKLVLEHLALGPHRDVLAGSHRERAGQ